MSFDPRDYDGITFESEERERREAQYLACETERERAEAFLALEMAFVETRRIARSPALRPACTRRNA